MLKLVKPDIKYYNQYKEMMDEWIMEGSRISPWPLSLKYHKIELFEEMIKRIEEVEQGKNLDGYASSTTYWLYEDKENKLLGAANLRHYLTQEGLKTWGHVGYGIRPYERKKGYATKLLKLVIQEARKKNLKRLLLASYEGNIGSWKVMEKCGAKLENIIIEGETGLPIKRYWISLKKKYANDVKDKFKDVEDLKQKIKSINEKDFIGDIYLNHFIKTKKPFVLCNGSYLYDNNYKWLEFYDYNSRVRLTSIYDENNKIVEWYFDIARSIGKENNVPYEDDMYLDIVLRPDGSIVLLDEDEFEEAYKNKEMTNEEYEEAYKITKRLMDKLRGKEKRVEQFTNKYLKQIL